VADPLGDLRLRHVLGETQAQHQALAFVQVGQRRLQRDPVLDQLEPLVLVADPLGRRSCSPRGTRTVQTRSRKWRFSSPRMVGEAKAVKGIPRSES
jgi:hypothetical protein